jgi:hypothetical protein
VHHDAGRVEPVLADDTHCEAICFRVGGKFGDPPGPRERNIEGFLDHHVRTRGQGLGGLGDVHPARCADGDDVDRPGGERVAKSGEDRGTLPTVCLDVIGEGCRGAAIHIHQGGDAGSRDARDRIRVGESDGAAPHHCNQE